MTRSALGWLDLLMPRDGGTQKLAADIAYGPKARHRLDIYAPKAHDLPRPVVFFIYGGGWDSGDKAEYQFAGHAMAAAGFVAVVADYRVLPEVRYPGFLEDGALALSWVLDTVASYGGDPAQIFLMGHSAGAYNAVMLGLDGGRFGAPALGERLRGIVGLSGPYDFYPFDVPASIAAFSVAPEPLLTQPINVVPPKPVPVFLGHGSRDKTCLPRNTIALGKSLRQAGGEVTERHYDNLAHPGPLLSLFPALRWRAPVYRDVVAFLRAKTSAGEFS
ncbi:alpha/beta hydrolase [Mariluticola halotolerans]|uniref:alpha/beta hydrolase n=1 Tax=Mariluticola halotolerans TaxID=2909283 RepID=UPI0026E3BF02|nr:alpha/beta hydrolase [Mariluticola halotolerans]UJQ93870.1 alpha/beta hydrolase [Mariluticola halotolerans]